jgi:sugar (pentulose or hexulose) kinase
MYLTFDVGTTSVKTVLYDRAGKLLGKAIREYRLDSPQVDWYELDPEIYWNSVIDGFREVLGSRGVNPSEIRSISGCSQGETFILLDEKDRSLRPAIVWYDNRAREEVEELKQAIDAAEFYHTTGLTEMETTWSAFKILWVKKNEPEIFSGIKKLLLVEDFIIYRLTGRYITTTSMNCSTALVDIQKRVYWNRMVDYIGIGHALPPIIDEGVVVERIKPEVAEKLGVGPDVVVVKGAMDQITSAVGAGNIRSGIVTETTGSALAVVVTVDELLFDRQVKLPYQPHIIPNKFTLLPYAQTSGIVYKWFKDNILADPERRGDNGGPRFEELNRLAASVPAGSEGIVFLPFLAGAHFPENDTYAKGVFYGITLKHDRAHFCRAIMESIGYLLRRILDPVRDFGIGVEEIHSMGGAARSDLWLQIKSDICNCPIVRMEEEETSTLGAAILASVQVGDYGSIEEAIGTMVKKGGRFEPNGANRAIYDRGYELYHAIYENLRETFRKFSD